MSQATRPIGAGIPAQMGTRNILNVLLTLGLLASSAMAALPTGFNQKVIFTGLDMVSSTILPDGRLLAIEKHGKIHVLNQATGAKSIALDWESKTWSSFEAGMVHVIAHPDFAANGYLYVQYTKVDAVGVEDHDWVSRFKMNGDVIDPASEFKILDLGAKGPNYHHGGGLAIKDGMLYIASGSRRCCMGFKAGKDDGNKSGENQEGWAGDTKRVEGKIHRVKLPDGEIPSDNPFYAANSGDAKAVWAYGLRNTFTISFHPTTGKLWGTDVQDGSGDDEVNELTANTGYGYGGGNKDAVFDASKASCGGGAMVGSLWYTGSNFPATYKDKYFFGQVRGCGSNLKYTDGSTFTTFGPFNTGNGNYSPIDVKMDGGGAIYVSTRYQTEDVRATNGQVIKVWYGDEPTGVFQPQHQPSMRAQSKLKWARNAGALSVRLLEDGVQTIQLQTLDGRIIAEREVSVKGTVEFPAGTKGVHILNWKSGNQQAAMKVML